MGSRDETRTVPSLDFAQEDGAVREESTGCGIAVPGMRHPKSLNFIES